MTDHLCLTCKLAEWKKTANERIHPIGSGKCNWKPDHIPTPKAWSWNFRDDSQQPTPMWGQIERRPINIIAECETYKAIDND